MGAPPADRLERVQRVLGRDGLTRLVGGVLFLTALMLGVGGPALALSGALGPAAGLPGSLGWAGLVVAVLGFAGVVAAQSGTGSSWRVGVDPGERTDLVTNGLFAVARNSIFTAMCAALLGITLMSPTPVTVAAFLALEASGDASSR